METVRRHMRDKSDVIGVIVLAGCAVVSYSLLGAYLLR